MGVIITNTYGFYVTAIFRSSIYIDVSKENDHKKILQFNIYWGNITEGN